MIEDRGDISEHNDWFITSTGQKVHVLSPSPSVVDIRDVAHALSNVCRFGGHCRKFFSVAEHSVRVMRGVEQWIAGLGDGEVEQNRRRMLRPLVKAALLHDAAEAYLGDVVRPLKNCLPEYRELEHIWEQVVCKALGVEAADTKHLLVKTVDRRDLLAARRDLGHKNWTKYVWLEDELDLQPLPELVECWTPEKAEAQFLGAWDRVNTPA